MNKTNQFKTCNNCSNEFVGDYCNNCGQLYFEKYKTSFIFKNIIDVFEFEIGYLLTFKSIYTNKNFIESYIQGKTQKYTNPIRFLFISLIFVSIIETILRFLNNVEMDNWIPFIPNEYITYLPLILIFYIILFLFYRKTNSKIKLLIGTIYIFSIFTILDTFLRIADTFSNPLLQTTVFFIVLFNISYIIHNNFYYKKSNKIYSILFSFVYYIVALAVFALYFKYF